MKSDQNEEFQRLALPSEEDLNKGFTPPRLQPVFKRPSQSGVQSPPPPAPSEEPPAKTQVNSS